MGEESAKQIPPGNGRVTAWTSRQPKALRSFSSSERHARAAADPSSPGSSRTSATAAGPRVWRLGPRRRLESRSRRALVLGFPLAWEPHAALVPDELLSVEQQ